MFYICNRGILEIKDTTDATYHELLLTGNKVEGQFGRLDYAQARLKQLEVK